VTKIDRNSARTESEVTLKNFSFGYVQLLPIVDLKLQFAEP
jgi:hypothetical protein